MKNIYKSSPSRYCWVALLLVLAIVSTAAILVFVQNSQTSGDDDDGPPFAPAYNGSRVTDTLRLVIAISRHGNRGGLEDYPLDPYPLKDTSYWPYGTNELTPFGRTQMYNLGLKLRSLYNNFLAVPYNKNEFYASCTAVERVVMSGELVLAGLYKPFGFQVWNENLPWQPVPIYSNSTDMSPVVDKCPRYVEEKAKALEQFLAQDAANITALTSYLTNVTGANATDSTLYFMFDKLVSEDLEGYDLPEWVQEIYPSPLEYFYGQDYITFFAGSDEIVRLVIGSFFEEVLSILKSKVDDDGLSSRKMHYYSAHDSSIVALQALLGIPKTSIIGVVHPGSAMIFELHQNYTTSQFYIETLYIEGTAQALLPRYISLPACGSPCYYDTLVNITQRFIGVDYDTECQTSSTTSTTPSESLYSNYLYT